LDLFKKKDTNELKRKVESSIYLLFEPDLLV